MTELEKQSKLDELQRKHRNLMAEKIPLQADFKAKSKALDRSRRALEKKATEIRDVSQQIFYMKHQGLTPHVTDHAIVRYLERVEGLDIWAIKEKVAADRNAVKQGNVIVTVNESLEDIDGR